LKQSAREKILKDFRDGRINVLVATDIVARGIDIKGIDLVINYDAPKDLDYYVHRIGRTARAKTSGSSFTLFDPRKSFTIKNIERHTGIKLEEYKVEVDETKVTNLHGERREFTSERKEFNHEPRKERTVNENATRFFINIGTKDNLDQGSLKSLLVEKCNINANDILDVYMKDMFSFIEVNNSATSNLSNFNEYNGRSIRIDKSNERKPTGGHNNNSRGGERRFGGSRGGGFGDRNKSFGGPRKFSNHGFGDRNKSFHSDGHKKFGDKKRTFGSFKKEY
jgi:ATP-dependent RNA helicase DeaD